MDGRGFKVQLDHVLCSDASASISSGVTVLQQVACVQYFSPLCVRASASVHVFVASKTEQPPQDLYGPSGSHVTTAAGDEGGITGGSEGGISGGGNGNGEMPRVGAADGA